MYVVYDDLREVGRFKKLTEVYRTGLIKYHLRNLQKFIRENEFYHDDNIFVFDINNKNARVRYLGECIARRAAINPDVYGLERILVNTLSSMLGRELTF